MGARRLLPDAAAQLRPVKAGHHPIDDRQRRRRVAGDPFPGRDAVVNNSHLETLPLQRRAQDYRCHPVVVGN